MQSGFPFTINLQGDTAGVGAGTGGIFVRPNTVPGVDWQLSGDERSTCAVLQYCRVCRASYGQFGNVGKNTVIGPGLANLDLVVAKV